MNRRAALGRLAMAPAMALGVLGSLERVAAGAQPSAGARCRPTRADMRGPFYVPGAPRRTSIAAPDEPGERLIVRGRVLGPDCQTPLAGALLDVWQADASGHYHDRTEQYRLRGQIRTDDSGRYELFSIRPGPYRVGDRWRPAHIHFTVSRPPHRPLTTQLYFKGDPYLAPNDACGPACGSDDPDRIIQVTKEEKMGGEFWVGTFEIVLGPAS
jgi:protocatechuate 3,4-dioxygenase beta subunit